MNEDCTNPTTGTSPRGSEQGRALVHGPTPSPDSVRCATWCDFHGDQICRSLEIPLKGSLLDDRVPCDQRVLAAGEEVRVFAERLPQEQEARVGFLDQDDRPTFLTPDEARDLARLLTHFAWVAEQDPRERNAFELGVDAGRAGFVRAGAEQ